MCIRDRGEAFHAVVGDAALREVVSADALATVATTHLQFALGGGGGGAFFDLGFHQHGLQAFHRLVAVGVLAAFGLRFHHHAGGNVGDANGLSLIHI